MHRLVPRARIILLLRDPVDRAHSNWSHLWGAGLESGESYADWLSLEHASNYH